MMVTVTRLFLRELIVLLVLVILPCSLGCTLVQFECTNGKCIPGEYACDRTIHCSDGSDEDDCHHQRCPSNEFTCANQTCIPYVYRCDGDNDCKDNSDEECDPYLDHFLIVADNGKYSDLYQIDLQTRNMLPLKVKSSKMAALAFDERKGDVYWTEAAGRAIIKYSLVSENTTKETIFKTAYAGALEGLALDVVNEKLYYCQADSTGRSPGLIGEMSLNGTNHRIILYERGQPRSIVLDTVNRLMYWTDRGPTPAIVRARMDDGGDRTVLVSSDIKQPDALAIDFEENILFWGDAWYHRIESINLTSNGDRELVLDESEINASYSAFALGNDDLYLTDRRQGSIRRLNLRTLNIYNQLPSDIFTRLNGIIYYNSKGATPLARTTTAATNQKTPPQYTAANQAAETSPDTGVLVLSTSKESSSIATVIVVVVGVVVMTMIITVGLVIIKARRSRNRLLLEKRAVVPPSERGLNSYYYSPFDATMQVTSAEATAAMGEVPPSTSSPSSFSPFARGAATRSSSFKPIIAEDALQANNIYSTVVGDYENIDTYEIIEDPFV